MFLGKFIFTQPGQCSYSTPRETYFLFRPDETPVRVETVSPAHLITQSPGLAFPAIVREIALAVTSTVTRVSVTS